MKWYEGTSEYSDVVISGRVRLARNLEKYPFPSRLSDEYAAKLVKEVKEGFGSYNGEEGKFLFCNLSEVSDSGKVALVEQHVLSPAIVAKNQQTGLLLTENNSVSVMINEEDHIRIQAMTSGMNMRKALKMANEADEAADAQLEYAYDKKYGYLTTCPTNTGTGMRASYMIFIPALVAGGKLNKLAEEVARYGMTIRGTYGEGTGGIASIFQISNQKTLGLREEDIISSLDNIVLQIVQQERRRREYVLENNYDVIEDQIYRSYGVLKYARQINTKDAMTLLSQVKLGFDTGILHSEKENNLFKLMMQIQPCSLQNIYGKNLGGGMRDKARAQYIRKSLPELLENI